MPAPIAVQLYSLREALQADPEPVFRRLAKTGFVGVETYRGLDASMTVRMCREYGLEICGAHLPPPVGDSRQEIIDLVVQLGIKKLIVPYMAPENFSSISSIRRMCETINEGARLMLQHGFEFGYHNHWFEPALIQGEGRTGLDIMRENLDPAIFFEVDTYWVQVAGQDPAALVRDLGPRAPMLHIKDGPASSVEASMVAAGQGAVNIPAIIEAAPNAEWVIVELDRCATDMMTAVVESYRYLVASGLATGRVTA
ncbi:MAG: sugar phosphate isomerase/epimerase [Anaerolineae bacterium]|nr:sugar phosphate isomerase/epimerase [Anaerolineae bacterium]